MQQKLEIILEENSDSGDDSGGFAISTHGIEDILDYTLDNEVKYRMYNDNNDTGKRLLNWRDVIRDDTRLRGWTGFNRYAYSLMYMSFLQAWEKLEREELLRKSAGILERVGKRGPRPMREIEEDRIKNVPLIHEDPIRRSNPGNRCKLDPIFILQVCLMRKYKSMGEWELGDLFGVDQSAISRYLRMGDRVLKEILPTPAKFVDRIRDITTPKAFAALFPEGDVTTTILIDGTHVKFARPIDLAERKAMYNGKQKECTGNTVVVCLPDKTVIALSDTIEGRRHDIAVTRESLLYKLGDFGRMLMGEIPLDPKCKKLLIKVLGDTGFTGLQKDLKGAKVVTPRRKPKKGKLTKDDKEFNRELSSERVIVENSICDAKQFKRVRGPYEGTLEDFNSELEVACGLANFRIMLRKNTLAHWQKELKGMLPAGIPS